MNLKHSLFDKSKSLFRVAHDESLASEKLAERLLTELVPLSPHRSIVFVCIGTDRSTGDSLGPLIGTKLQEQPFSPFHVYGTLAKPIHALNLDEMLEHIQKLHVKPFIIGIDACLGRSKNIGTVTLGIGPVKPGAGVNKNLSPVGDIHIAGIVNVSGLMEFFVLQNTRLHLVMSMADMITEGIALAGKEMQRIRKPTLLKVPPTLKET
ncbi:spore protease YyaC [Priestia filamentosa]|uniref:Spore protease YyaC n=1 Tax=Priestia filamentosa TaxID=1402861 RepID=A0A1X7G6Q5_9BACI|nr:spore protease YyaC [Priestia filamentosa]AKO94895.1 spore protease YyaC [Priestia filamentosa]MDT3765240.1 spore protease YyaC [Priestia filamentosa]MED3728035.1 spore protease YyaC [Priestia filamentosa]OXS65630.1 spore protease YyaC [Priestia filamentosa]RJS65977.1 spore protease YyaC [Priestia filamentosa]